MYSMTIEPFNYVAVFGTMLGIVIIMQVENMVKNSVTFVKGFRSN